MKKHNWRVGALTEMSPLEVTKLGHNVNKGLEISLRLRFQDGFRSYDSIKEVMYHELAHMEISPHDASFKALNSQIRREAKEFDAGSKRSRTLVEGYSTEARFPGYNEIPEEEVDQGGVGYKLGGGGGESDSLKNVLTPREMAARAAMLRVANSTPTSESANPNPPKAQPPKADAKRTVTTTTSASSTSRPPATASTPTPNPSISGVPSTPILPPTPVPLTQPTTTESSNPSSSAPATAAESSVCPICGFVFPSDTSNRGINLHIDQHFK
eukprot:TRINITY_DN1643_c0_g1_i2.p1 TRINITY_DN1643_c0_g1~~TRINITY_DN1643_c0_g1_i2.p1  ORF type:complete len:270 (-),score=47.75 TRINITY_DN1643_c0_g1_i2:76-885(-)